jgi:hypothetical protein
LTEHTPNLDQIIADAAERDRPASAPTEAAPDPSIPLEKYQLDFTLKCLESALNQLNDNHTLRLKYTGKIYGLVLCWLVGVVVCIAASGVGAWGFKLPEAVLIAFITSTTLNVLGLFVLVAKWMYPAGTQAATAESLVQRAHDLKAKIE